MIRIIILGFIALFFVNCSTKNLSPVNVSDYFWVAQKEHKLEDAKKFVRDNDTEKVALQKSIKIKRFTFSDAQENGDKAVVPTQMFLEGMLSTSQKDEIEVDFDTVLEKKEDGWKVNVTETKQGLYIETAKKFGAGLGSGLFSKLKEGLGGLKGLQGVFEEMINGLKKSLEK